MLHRFFGTWLVCTSAENMKSFCIASPLFRTPLPHQKGEPFVWWRLVSSCGRSIRMGRSCSTLWELRSLQFPELYWPFFGQGRFSHAYCVHFHMGGRELRGVRHPADHVAANRHRCCVCKTEPTDTAILELTRPQTGRLPALLPTASVLGKE